MVGFSVTGDGGSEASSLPACLTAAARDCGVVVGGVVAGGGGYLRFVFGSCMLLSPNPLRL